MKIGHQGLVGSNSEEATKVFIAKLKFEQAELIPLISSKDTIDALLNKEVDYAVLAMKNTVGGDVIESLEAIENRNLELVDIEVLHIHHCLYKKNDAIMLEELTEVASHIQALKQTERTRQELFPTLKEVETADTASAARDLASGILPESMAVICRKNAGEKYKLSLIQENIESEKNNATEFRIFKLPN